LIPHEQASWPGSGPFSAQFDSSWPKEPAGKLKAGRMEEAGGAGGSPSEA